MEAGFGSPAGKPAKTWQVIDKRHQASPDEPRLKAGSQAPPHAVGGVPGRRGLRTTHSNEGMITSVHSIPGATDRSHSSGVIGMWGGPRRHDPANQSTMDMTMGRLSPTPQTLMPQRSPQFSSSRPHSGMFASKPSMQTPAPANDTYVSRRPVTNNQIFEKLYQQSLNGNCAGGKYGKRQRAEEVAFRDKLRPEPRSFESSGVHNASTRSRTSEQHRKAWGAGAQKKEAWNWTNPYRGTSFKTQARKSSKSAPPPKRPEFEDDDPIWEKLFTEGDKSRRNRDQKVLDDKKKIRDSTKRSKTTTCYELAYSTFGSQRTRMNMNKTHEKAGAVRRKEVDTIVEGDPFARLYQKKTGRTKPSVLALTEPKPQSFRPKKRLYHYEAEKRAPRPWHRSRSAQGSPEDTYSSEVPAAPQRSQSPEGESVSRVPSLDVARLHSSGHDSGIGRRHSTDALGQTDVTMLPDPEVPQDDHVETQLLDHSSITESARKHYSQRPPPGLHEPVPMSYSSKVSPGVKSASSPFPNIPKATSVFSSVNEEVEAQRQRKREEEEENKRELERLREQRDRASVKVRARVQDLESGSETHTPQAGARQEAKPFNFMSLQESASQETNPPAPAAQPAAQTAAVKPFARANPPPRIGSTIGETPPRVAAPFQPSPTAQVPKNPYEARDSRPLPRPNDTSMRPSDLVMRGNASGKAASAPAGASPSRPANGTNPTRVAAGGSLWPDSDSEEDLAC